MDTFDKIQKEMEDMLNSDDVPTKDELLENKKGDLVELCKKFELASYGNKEELAERLLTYYKEVTVLGARSSIVAVKESNESGEAKRV